MKKLLAVCSVLLLFALLSLLMGASVTKSLVIDVTEDAYVVTDVNDPEDTYGIMNENYGDLEFVKAWYLWNVVEEEVIPEVAEGEEAVPELVEVEYERIVSVIYLKFDLTELEDMEIETAMLQLYAQNVALLAPRYVQAYQVESDWDELTISFNTAPPWGQNALATTTVYQADQWYGWDVTGGVTSEISSGQFSLAVTFRDMEKASEELVAFPSHESGENASRLLITYTESGFVFSWYWWVIGGVVVLALLGLAFFFGLKRKRRKS